MDSFVGEIKQFGGDFAPTGWAFCDGRLLEIKTYEVLYRLLGTRYGGDGTTNFAVPDLRGRVGIHMTDKFPQGVKGGHEEVTLTEAEMASHTHIAYATGSTNIDSPAENGFWGASASDFSWAAAPGDLDMSKESTTAAGGGKSHENRVPIQATSFIISLFGIYPNQP